MIAHAEYHVIYLFYMCWTMLPPPPYPVEHIDPDLIARRPNPPDPSETHNYPKREHRPTN